MIKRIGKGTWLIRIFGRYLRVKGGVFHSRFSCNKSGKWPLALWVYKWGIHFHGGSIADAHLELSAA